MACLPLANILHHKVGSLLSAFGIGIGVCMMITLAGLSRGTFNEVVDRWAAVDADLIVCPASTNLTMASGGAISLSALDRIAQVSDPAGRRVAQHVLPVYLARLTIGKREHNLFGLRADDFAHFTRQPKMLSGRLPDPEGQFERWLAERFDRAAESGELLDIAPHELAAAGGLELAIDDVLARDLGATVGDMVSAAGHQWTIVGVYRTGAVSRAVAPLAALQYLFSAQRDRVTLLFVKLAPGIAQPQAVQSLRSAAPGQNVVPLSEYKAMLMQNFGLMYAYVDAVNIIALAIAFLFIMVTLYTMVLQRTREIAILKSMGAGWPFLLRNVLAESMALTAAGAGAGIVMSFAAAWLIERFRPDLTVAITARWVGIGLLAALGGGLAASLYPAWRAGRVDVAEAMTLE